MAMNTYRIPSSLKWLINTYARLQGDLKKSEARFARSLKTLERDVTNARQRLEKCEQQYSNAVKDQEAVRSEIKDRLDALHTVFTLHQIKIEPETIPPKMSNRTGPRPKQGVITRGVYASFQKSKGQPLTTTDIVESILMIFQISFYSDMDYQDFRRRVRRCLNHLSRNGSIKSINSDGQEGEPLWSLVESWGVHGNFF